MSIPSPDWSDVAQVTENRLSEIQSAVIPYVMSDLARNFISSPSCHGMTVADLADDFGLCVSQMWSVIDFLSVGGIVLATVEDGECACDSCRARRSWVELPYSFEHDRAIAIAQQQAENIVRECTATPARPGHVYLMKCQDRYKIGISRNIPARQRQLQQQSPFPIELVHSAYGPDYKAMEQTLHAKYHHVRVQGEWFTLDDQQLADIVTEMNEWERTHER